MRKAVVLLALLCCLALLATSCKFLDRKLVPNQEKEYPKPVSELTSEDPQTIDTPIVEEPVEEPTDDPTEDPSEEPSEEPNEDPAEDPSEEPEEPQGDPTPSGETPSGNPSSGDPTPSSGDSQDPEEEDSPITIHENGDSGQAGSVDWDDFWN